MYVANSKSTNDCVSSVCSVQLNKDNRHEDNHASGLKRAVQYHSSLVCASWLRSGLKLLSRGSCVCGNIMGAQHQIFYSTDLNARLKHTLFS